MCALMQEPPRVPSQLGGIVLAAGASSRMGRPKGALPIGVDGETIIARVVRVLCEAGLPRVVVVTGAHPAVADSLDLSDGRVRVVHHPGWPDGQLSSLQCGLRVLEQEGPVQGVVMTLVDVPLVQTATVATLIEVWTRTGAPIVRPMRGTSHGHPVLFDAAVLPELAAADPQAGAKPVVRAHEAQMANVLVEDAGAFFDVDTPDDYARALTLGAPDPV